MSASEEQANAVRLLNYKPNDRVGSYVMSKATSHLTGSLDKYLALPFEVPITDRMPIIEMQLMSDVEATSFEEVRIAIKKEGDCYSATFRSASNNGHELVACLLNRIGPVAPAWLQVESDEYEINYEQALKVEIKDRTITFKELSDEEQDPDSECFIDLDEMEHYCGEPLFCYNLEDASPDYVILDAENSRVAVSLDGYVLDEHGEETTERIFIPKRLEEWAELQKQNVMSYADLQESWMRNLLSEEFPDNKDLSLRPIL